MRASRTASGPPPTAAVLLPAEPAALELRAGQPGAARAVATRQRPASAHGAATLLIAALQAALVYMQEMHNDTMTPYQ